MAYSINIKINKDKVKWKGPKEAQNMLASTKNINHETATIKHLKHAPIWLQAVIENQVEGTKFGPFSWILHQFQIIHKQSNSNKGIK